MYTFICVIKHHIYICIYRITPYIVCVCAYIYIYLHAYTHMQIYTCLCMYIYLMCVYIYAHTHTYIHTHKHTHSYIYLNIHVVDVGRGLLSQLSRWLPETLSCQVKDSRPLLSYVLVPNKPCSNLLPSYFLG